MTFKCTPTTKCRDLMGPGNPSFVLQTHLPTGQRLSDCRLASLTVRLDFAPYTIRLVCQAKPKVHWLAVGISSFVIERLPCSILVLSLLNLPDFGCRICDIGTVNFYFACPCVRRRWRGGAEDQHFGQQTLVISGEYFSNSEK